VRLAVLLVVTACRVNFDDVVPAVDAPSLSAYAAAVLADHPVAYWRLGDSGSIARDELGMHDGNYSSGVTTGVAGALVDDPDHAADFDGTTGEVTTTTGISFPGAAPFTLEIWVNEPMGPLYRHYLTSEPRGDNKPLQGYALFENGSGVQFERIATPIAFDQTNVVAFASHRWTYLVGVYTGTAVELYVDGVVRDTQPALDVADDYAAPILLGANSDGALFTGTLDEAAIYDSALSPARIAAHYAIARGN
jgi:large repetitive protein